MATDGDPGTGGRLKSWGPRTRTGLLALSRRFRRNALVIDQALIVAFTMVHLGLCLAWINLYLPSFGVYTQDFTFSWAVLAATALHPIAPLTTAYALRRLVDDTTRKWIAKLATTMFVLFDVAILLVGVFFRWLYCPNDSSPPLCTPTTSLEALLYFHVGFLVADFILVSLVHKLIDDANVYMYGPTQLRVREY